MPARRLGRRQSGVIFRSHYCKFSAVFAAAIPFLDDLVSVYVPAAVRCIFASTGLCYRASQKLHQAFQYGSMFQVRPVQSAPKHSAEVYASKLSASNSSKMQQKYEHLHDPLYDDKQGEYQDRFTYP